MSIKLKRAYDEAAKNDGTRILVDRLWPRGVSKEDAKIDEWLKEIGPTDDLRKKFHNEEITFNAFKKQYLKQLEAEKRQEALDELKKLNKSENQITLVFAAKDEEENQAVVLKEILSK